MGVLKGSFSFGLLIASAIVFSTTSARSEDIPTRGPIPFTAYDKDGNSLISEQEFNAVRGERMAARAATDRPMRGAAGAPSFSEFDTNGDGQLTQEELAAGQRAQMEKRRGMGRGQSRGMGQGMRRSMPSFPEYDLDGDGKILEKEFSEARSKRTNERAQQGYQIRNFGQAPSFTDIDVDGNGEISAEEFAAHQSQRRKQRAQ